MEYNADLKSQKINYRKSKKSFDKLFTTFFAEPKVGYLYKAVFVKQQVVQFEIPKDKKKIKKRKQAPGNERQDNSKTYRYTILWS